MICFSLLGEQVLTCFLCLEFFHDSPVICFHLKRGYWIPAFLASLNLLL